MAPKTAKALEELRLDLQLIRRRANELQSDFEICDDINLAVISALKYLERLELEGQVSVTAAVVA
jgi:hypothetical protein